MSNLAQTITAPELKTWLSTNQDALVLDVRSAAEYETMHIEGSHNVPLPLLTEYAGEIAKNLNSKVVFVCQSGVRATEAKNNIAKVGFSDAYVLDGGVPEFNEAGGDVVEGNQRWALDRQVRMAAGSLVVAGLVGGKFLSPRVRTLSGLIGAGLTFSAATNTCAMGKALSALPWNKAATEPTLESVLAQLPATKA